MTEVAMKRRILPNPDEQTLKMIPEITKATLVPFDELGLDAND